MTFWHKQRHRPLGRVVRSPKPILAIVNVDIGANRLPKTSLAANELTTFCLMSMN